MEDRLDDEKRLAKLKHILTELRPSVGALVQYAEARMDGNRLILSVPGEFAKKMLERPDINGMVFEMARSLFRCEEMAIERTEPRVEVPASEYARLKETEWHAERIAALLGFIPDDGAGAGGSEAPDGCGSMCEGTD